MGIDTAKKWARLLQDRTDGNGKRLYDLQMQVDITSEIDAAKREGIRQEREYLTTFLLQEAEKKSSSVAADALRKAVKAIQEMRQ